MSSEPGSKHATGTSLEHVPRCWPLRTGAAQLLVTQSYSDLASSLAALLDPDTANWAPSAPGRRARWDGTFEARTSRMAPEAGWCSTTDDGRSPARRGTVSVGHFTHRFHDVTPDEWPRRERGVRVLRHEPVERQHRGLRRDRPVAATFITVYGETPSADEGARAGVLAACDGAPEFEGVNHLAAGFSLWCDALNTTDPIRRSQLILALAPPRTHEQHHLQGRSPGAWTWHQPVHRQPEATARERGP